MADTRFTAAAESSDERSRGDEGEPERPTGERFDELLDALSVPCRRLVVEYVDEHERATLRELAEHVAERQSSDGPAADALEVSLYHAHVPRLVDAGLLAYDGDRKRVRRGDRFDADALLE